LEIYLKKQMPAWGADLSGVGFEGIHYYMAPEGKVAKSWADLPKDIRKTYDFLGIPEAEKNFLAGVSAQYESEVMYKSIQSSLEKEGVIFLDTDSALQKYPEIFEKYFGKLIPPGDNKFAALNSAVWSGGSFVFIPAGVKVTMPLQAYFRINAESMGQFERTLIVAEKGSSVHYIEGCSAPIYSSSSLHSAVVEIFVEEGAKVRYTTIQNWSPNVYNLVTKRAQVAKNGTMQWIDGNLGSKVTMKYPACYLVGEGARGEVLSIAFAGKGQHQDAGAKMMHLAKNTSSRIISKSVSKDGGRTSYRGLAYVKKGAQKSKTKVVCDALIVDKASRSDTYPKMKIDEQMVNVEHEATVSKVGEEQLFYLSSRGLKPERAETLIVNGFLEPIIKELPLEYAVEINRLISMEMEGSVG
jgi:Fe-S cluster assembly protein SufB